MQVRELAVPGAYELTPVRHEDERGVFFEWFRSATFEQATGHRLALAQANCSVSRPGVLRGVHFADVPPGQAKYVTCLSGAVLDLLVDVRTGSPTFGQAAAVRLDTVDRRAVYLSEGLGHAFLALEPDSTVVYLCSTPYAPDREHAVNPTDPDLALPLPADLDLVLSPKDLAAPGLAAARSQGLLPSWQACRERVERLREALAAGPGGEA